MRRGQLNGTLYVNWLKHREPFHFDQVWVRKVDDLDLDEFMVRIRNDNDTDRLDHLHAVPIYVFRDAGLARAKTNLLMDTLDRVESKAREV